MKIAVTGGTGFVGSNLAVWLVERGHDVVLVARGRDTRDPRVRLLPRVTLVHASVTDERRLREVFTGCDGVVHLAGVPPRSSGPDLHSCHVRGTIGTVDAARDRGVERLVMLSPVRASPEAASPYHASKWQAEQIVRASGSRYTVVKSAVVFGRGDRLVAHLSRALHTFPVFPLIGYARPTVRPVAVEDLAALLGTAVTGEQLVGHTVAVLGPEDRSVSDVVRIVGLAAERRPLFVRLPPLFRRRRRTTLERLLDVPVPGRRRVVSLDEAGVTGEAPPQLRPATPFDVEAVRRALPDPRSFSLDDVRSYTAA